MLPIVQPGELTEMDRFVFESYGYFIIEDVLTPKEVEEALAASQRLHEDVHSEGRHQIGAGFENEPALENLIDHPATFPKVRGLLGDRFVLQAAFCTIQPANTETIGWHRDGSSAYQYDLLGYPTPLLQLRVSFNLTDQCNENMGNMAMIPGSHRSPVPIPGDKRKQMGNTSIEHIVKAKPGTALIFHNGVFHTSTANDMDFDRYNMHYIYSPPWLRRSDRFATDPAFLERTTPLRRALMGDYDRPDTPFGGGGFPIIPFDD